MCIPCFPHPAHIHLEPDPKGKKKRSSDKGADYVWDNRVGAWAKVTGTGHKIPAMYAQPGYMPQPQPVYSPYAQPSPYQHYQPYQQYPYAVPYAGIPQPAYGTYGMTATEVLSSQMALAQNSDIDNKQEMKPGDDDPFRMYWVREEDGSWTQRNRLTIDSGDIGECRWFSHDGGKFYAVRLPTG